MWLHGAVPGEPVANYIFCWEDGNEETIAIRERFEIGHFPQPWGHAPFLAVPDRHDGTQPLRGGPWTDAGLRLTEVTMAMTHAYTLWSWTNPKPDLVVEAVRIEPLRSGFIVAGVTTGHVDEEPLRLPPRLPVVITKSDGVGGGDPIELEIDRGVATYTYETTPHGADDWEGLDGWGGSDTSQRSVYTFVSAIPSATVDLRRGELAIGAFRWSKAQEGGLNVGDLRVEVLPPDRNWVHVTVRDESGDSVACRISFTSESGIPYPPHGHSAPVQSGLRAWNLDVGGDVLLGDVSYAYIDGRCQGWLPTGRVWVEIARGFEYEPVKTQVEIGPGQRQLDLSINRWIDVNAEGWYSGDTHVHFLSPDGALTEASGEGLSVVNLLVAQWGHLFTNVEDFTGRTRVSDDGQTLVHVSQENRQHMLGHLNLLGLSKPVMPFSSDGPSEGELGGGLDTTTSRWADEAHEQGATVIVAHMPTPNGETAVLIATGRADGLEMIDFNHFEHLEYYRYLNGGYRLPLVAGTDKMEATIPVGMYRTYAQLEEELSLDAWLRAVRAGRTFATSGPILTFNVDGLGPGAAIARPVGSRVTVQATARSIFPIHSLQIIQGGDVVAEHEVTGGTHRLQIDEEIEVSAHGWLAARCAGPNYGPGTRHFDHDRRPVMAHTSPVYLDTGVRRPQVGETARYLKTLVEGGLGYVMGAIHHPQGSVAYSHGRPDHEAYLAEPFLDALGQLEKRISQWEHS